MSCAVIYLKFDACFCNDIYMQGPLAAPVLQYLTKEDLSKLYFGEFQILDINGARCFLTRTGYVKSINSRLYFSIY